MENESQHRPAPDGRSEAALIGDIVGSRITEDRRDVHRRLVSILTGANETLHPASPLRVTAGDEFQGVFATIGQALTAGLWIRLHLLPDVDVRVGVGWGALTVLQEEPRIEDGPAWWAARRAIELAEERAQTAQTRAVRTAFHTEVARTDAGAINAALVCRDQLIDPSDARSVQLLRGLLRGGSQVDLAREEGISPSAVSQRVRKRGLGAVVLASELLEGVS